MNDDGFKSLRVETAEFWAYCCKGCASLKFGAKLDQKA
jgi:hypothetical protein